MIAGGTRRKSYKSSRISTSNLCNWVSFQTRRILLVSAAHAGPVSGSKACFHILTDLTKCCLLLKSSFICCLRDLQLYPSSSCSSTSILRRPQLRAPGLNTPPDSLCVCLCLTCQMMVDIRIHNEDGGCLPEDEEPLTCIVKQQLGRCRSISELSHFMNW